MPHPRKLQSHLPAATCAALYAITAPFLGRPWFSALAVGAAAVALIRWTPGLWTAATLATAGSFGLVIDLVATAGSGHVENWPRLLNGLFCATAAVLFAIAATATHRRKTGRCIRCGTVHAPELTRKTAPEPSTPPRWIRTTAYLGAAAFLPYISIKTIWAFGITIDKIPPPELQGDNPMGALAAGNIDLTALLAVLAAILNVALVSRWGQRFPRWTLFLNDRPVPRWIPLTPAWLGAATLAPYGLGMAVMLPFWPALDIDAPWWIVAAGALGFGGFGLTAGIAAWWYQKATRPICR